MSLEAMERCRLLPIRGWPKSILMLLAYHTNPKTGQCDPSEETLAVESGAYRETVIGALTELKRLGVVSARRRRRKSAAYTIHFEAFEDIGKNRLLGRAQDVGKTGSKKSAKADTNLKEPKEEAAAGRRRPAATAQAGRDAPPPEPKSEISTAAARARGRWLAPSHAHGNGRAAHEPEARQVRAGGVVAKLAGDFVLWCAKQKLDPEWQALQDILDERRRLLQ
jgi:hypothetical protein